MVKEFRDAFRVSQNDMAQHLGISRSQLSMIEMGQRKLADKKQLQLARFHEPVHAVKGTGNLTNKEFIALRQKQQERKAEMIGAEILIHQRKLQAVRNKMKKLFKDQDHCEQVFEQMDNLYSIATKQERSLINIIEHETMTIQENCGENNLLKLAMQEAGLQAIINFLEGSDKKEGTKPISVIVKKKSKKKINDQGGGQLTLL